MKNVVAGKNVNIASPSVSAHAFPEEYDNTILIKKINPPIPIIFFRVSKTSPVSAIIAPSVDNANHGKIGYVPFSKSLFNHSSNPSESTLDAQDSSDPLKSPRISGLSDSMVKIELIGFLSTDKLVVPEQPRLRLG